MRLYNTMTRKKEEFISINEGQVKMYSCGPTVYNYFHIGNARPFIIFDTLRRYLEYKGNDVTFVQNFTDIDDKVIKKANEENMTVKELTDKYIEEYFIDARGLGIKDATIHPKATENIDVIIEIIKTLEEKGYAYAANGDVYFNSRKFKEYGKLSHQDLEQLETGIRIDVDENKKDAIDFVLWKAQKEGEPGWESPWGMGRPGWHIECSAMVKKYLGETIDIHSGGKDLVFPHHENEIAQSEAANEKPFARYWLHNGFINVDNEKMSKSKGNFFTVRDIVKHFDYEVLRFFMLSAHYRSPINFSDELLNQAKSSLERIYNCLDTLKHLKSISHNNQKSDTEKKLVEKLLELKSDFMNAMDDDLNTASAIASVFEIVRQVNTDLTHESKPSEEIIDFSLGLIKELGEILGVAQNESEVVLDKEIELLIAERQQARKDKNWKLADEIRDKLKQSGIILEDTPQGVKWKKI